MVLTLSGLAGIYGFIMSFLIATSIGLNSYTLEELDSIERSQHILRSVIAVGAIIGTAGAVLAALQMPFASLLLLAAGLVAAVGLALVATGWSAVAGPRLEYFLGPVPVMHWVTAGVLERSRLAPILAFPLRAARESRGATATKD